VPCNTPRQGLPCALTLAPRMFDGRREALVVSFGGDVSFGGFRAMARRVAGNAGDVIAHERGS
jgi:hypothetical protein